MEELVTGELAVAIDDIRSRIDGVAALRAPPNFKQPPRSSVSDLRNGLKLLSFSLGRTEFHIEIKVDGISLKSGLISYLIAIVAICVMGESDD
jgi:hypothetical protein